MTISRAVLFASAAFIGGVFVSSFFPFPALVPLALFGLFLVLVGWLRATRVMVAGLVILFAVLGIAREQASLALPAGWEGMGQSVSFTARVVSEPDLREDGLRLELAPDFASLGRVLVFTDRFFRVGYGDTLAVSGTLEAPAPFDSFDYPSYLKSQGVYAVMFRPGVERLTEDHGFLSSFLDLKDRVRQAGANFLEPESSFLLGAMVLGDKDRMPDVLKDKLSSAGVRHITAVSGMHVAILSSLLLSLLLRAGMPRREALGLALLVVVFFVVFTGLQASALRAGIMGGLLIVGQAFYRRSQSSRALVFAAASMLALNPLLLLHDTGFQLSFVAVLGIMWFQPFFSRFLGFLPGFVSDLAALSLSAQALTLPLIAHSFGAVSVSSFAANLLLVPLVPLVFALGVPFYAASFLSHVAFLVSLPLSLLLSFFSFVVDQASSFPLVRTESVPVLLLPFVYAFLWLLSRRIKRREFFLRHPSGTISEW